MFFLDLYIPQSGSMIISYLKRKVLCRTEDRAKNIKFINKAGKKIKGEVIFSRCYGHGVLLVTIDLESFEFYQGRLFPIDW